MDILDRVNSVYELASLCNSYMRTNAEVSRQGALNAIFLSDNEELKEKLLGHDAYIDMKVYEKKIDEDDLEEFMDFFNNMQEKKTDAEKLNLLESSLRNNKEHFKKVLVVDKIKDYFPLELIKSYIKIKK